MTRFERRLYVGFAILVLLFTPILIGSFVVISQLETTQGDLLSKNAQDVIQSERLSSLLHEETALVQGYVLRGDASFVRQVEQVHQHFQATASTLILGVEPEEDPAVLQELKKVEQLNYSRIGQAVELRKAGGTIADLNKFFETGGVEIAKSAVDLVEKNVQTQNDQLHRARDYVNRTSKRLVWGLILACAIATAATAFIILLLFQMIRRKALDDQRRDERLRLESDLSNARKEAVEVVAHDLKNPLSSMKMAMEIFADEVAHTMQPGSDAVTALDIATRSIKSMQRLIDDTLDHTKIESGQLTLDRTLKNVTELLKDTEVRFRPLFEAKTITFAARFDRVLFAEIDSARMEQVLSNLLGNALKFTLPGGMVQLLGTRRANEIVLTVKDNGAGISLEARSHIFERYYQVRENAKKGTGLGLSIAKGIVEAHGGNLKCSSEVGVGTDFEVTFAAADLGRSSEMTH